MDAGISNLLEEGLASAADSIGEKIDTKWWSKILYPLIVVGVLAIPVIYYFW